jgi:hypothetical protein
MTVENLHIFISLPWYCELSASPHLLKMFRTYKVFTVKASAFLLLSKY